MITQEQKAELLRLIAVNTQARIDLSWIGSQDPEDHGAIEYEADFCLRKLESFIDILTQE